MSGGCRHTGAAPPNTGPGFSPDGDCMEHVLHNEGGYVEYAIIRLRTLKGIV